MGELKQGDVFISTKPNGSVPLKLEVLDVTKTTYRLKNMDSGYKFRVGKWWVDQRVITEVVSQ